MGDIAVDMKKLELRDTIEGMVSSDYKERFKAEYQQVKIRHQKLKNFCDRIELAEIHGVGEAPKHDCPLSLLRRQQNAMGMYMNCLEERALFEKIELP